MATTYTKPIATDRDRVRFLTGDTDTSNAVWDDDEIAWELTEAGDNVYFAAANLLDQLLAKWNAKGSGKGIVRKKVDVLAIDYGSDATLAEALRSRISSLRRRGRGRPRYMRAAGGG